MAGRNHGTLRLLSVGNQPQSGYAQVIAAVVRHERHVVAQRRGGDPGVGALYPAPARLRSHSHFRPHRTEPAAVMAAARIVRDTAATIRGAPAPTWIGWPTDPVPPAS